MFTCGTCWREFPAGWHSRQPHMNATGHCQPDFECDSCESYFGSQRAEATGTSRLILKILKILNISAMTAMICLMVKMSYAAMRSQNTSTVILAIATLTIKTASNRSVHIRTYVSATA